MFCPLVVSSVHQVWPKASCKAQCKGEEDKADTETEEEVGRQHQGLDRPGVRQVPEGSKEQKEEKKKRKLVVKSSVVPKQPSQLRDR